MRVSADALGRGFGVRGRLLRRSGEGAAAPARACSGLEFGSCARFLPYLNRRERDPMPVPPAHHSPLIRIQGAREASAQIRTQEEEGRDQ